VWLAWEKYGWLGKSVAGLGKIRLAWEKCGWLGKNTAQISASQNFFG